VQRSTITLDSEPMRTVFVHCHIMKNGGTTIEYVLQREFGAAFYRVHRNQDDGRILPEELGEFLASQPDVRAVTSHHFEQPLKDIPRVVLFVCCPLRHPFERFTSLYRYYRSIETDQVVGRLAHDHELPVFLRALLDNMPNYVCNGQTVALGNRMRFDVLNESHLSAAVSLMQRSVNVVVDRMDESLTVAEYFLEPAFPGLQLHYVPQNRTSRETLARSERAAEFRDACGPVLFQQLQRVNEFDLRLFDAADAELDRRIAMVPIFAERLEEFRSRCLEAGSQNE
jgi:hypothetical protein